MKKFFKVPLVLSGLAASLIATAPAQAIVTVTTSAIGVIAPGDTVIFDADGSAAGLTGNFITFNATQGNAAALPGNSTNQIAVLGGDIATLTVDRWVNSLSIDWGSIDTYNRLLLFTNLGTLTATGANFPPANGNRFTPQSNSRVKFQFDNPTQVFSARFESDADSFEWDTVSINAVPEPGTWAMLIAGFGLVGAAARRRRQTSVLA